MRKDLIHLRKMECLKNVGVTYFLKKNQLPLFFSQRFVTKLQPPSTHSTVTQILNGPRTKTFDQ